MKEKWIILPQFIFRDFAFDRRLRRTNESYWNNSKITFKFEVFAEKGTKTLISVKKFIIFSIQGKIAKDARECAQECVSEFISFITSEASDRCQVNKWTNRLRRYLILKKDETGLKMNWIFLVPFSMFKTIFKIDKDEMRWGDDGTIHITVSSWTVFPILILSLHLKQE